MINERLKNYIFYILTAVILALGFILRLKGYVSNPSFWLDESALGWNVLNKSYSELFDKLRFLQIAPPLFLCFTKFLIFITDGYHHMLRCDIVLRTIPFIAGNLSLILFYFIGKKVFTSKWTILAGLIFMATNPALINYSFEFKPYNLDVLSCLVVILIFLNINFKQTTFKTLFLYGLILAVLPWFSFASVFVITAGFMTLSFNKENPKAFTSLLALPFVSAFFYLRIFIINAYTQNSVGMHNFWQQHFVNTNFSNSYALLNDNFKYFFMSIPDVLLLLAGICLITGFVLILKNKDFKYLLITTLTFAAVIATSILKFYPFSGRLILFLIPISIIYIVKITDIKKWFIGWIVILILLVPQFTFAGNFIFSKNITKGDDARYLMQNMVQRIKNKDIIVLNENSYADYFYYNTFFNKKNKIEYIKPNYKTGEDNQILLNKLQKGTYWLFLSYDNNKNRTNITEITQWAYKNTKVLYELKTQQSALIKLVID